MSILLSTVKSIFANTATKLEESVGDTEMTKEIKKQDLKLRYRYQTAT